MIVRQLSFSKITSFINHSLFAGVMLLSVSSANAQTETPPAAQQPTSTTIAKTNVPPQTAETIAKAEKIIARSVEVLGKDSYLGVRTVTARGLFTPFQDGTSGVPSSFVDYLVYPDKERTEFRSEGVRTVQSNSGDGGWIYDGAARTLKDMKPPQIENFHFAMRTSLEYLLRGWWRKDKAQLGYIGRREAGIGKRNETVALTHTDGLIVEYEFGAGDGLPARIGYKRKNDSEEEVAEEDRFAQFITVDGVLTPFILDHFRAGVQTSRINNQSVELNRPIPDELFQKPADIKAFKK